MRGTWWGRRWYAQRGTTDRRYRLTGDSHEQSFILADVRMHWTLSHSEVFLFLSPDGMAVVAPFAQRLTPSGGECQ